jgi:hypothetical protein
MITRLAVAKPNRIIGAFADRAAGSRWDDRHHCLEGRLRYVA